MASSIIKNSNPLVIPGTNFRFKSLQFNDNRNRLQIYIPPIAYIWLNGFIITRYGQHAFIIGTNQNGDINRLTCTKLNGTETITATYSGTTAKFQGEEWNSFNVFYATPISIGTEDIWADLAT